MKHIVVVGGGTAGWLTADYLAAKLGDHSGDGLKISLVEAKDIPTIGVGEATTPSLRATMADIGVDEYDFMRVCNATFKHGILFANWTHTPEEDADDAYFHPFERPLRAGTDGLESYWLRGLDADKRDFDDAVSIQYALARDHLAPKSPNDRPYDSPIPYAYHLDAGLLADSLKAIGMQRGVNHIVGRIIGLDVNETGEVSALQLESGDSVSGDLYIDCSGFASILIGKHYDREFADRSDVLFCDSAVACQVPNKPEQRIAPYTRSTAMPNGWIWDIGLSNRRGTGHVYSSRHTDGETAEAELRAYIGSDANGLPARHLKFRVGYRPEQWYRNCVAVGLSGGFIEPLESTGIHLIEQSAWALAAMIPRYFSGIEPQSSYNSIMSSHYEMAINFVKYHYLLSKRTDTDFWRENVDPKSWTPWLREKVEQWEKCYPDVYDLERLHSIFDHASYQYVYFGMEGRPKLSDVGGLRDRYAQSVFEKVSAGLANARQRLPSHEDFLREIHRHDGDGAQIQPVEALSKVNASIRNIPNNYTTR